MAEYSWLLLWKWENLSMLVALDILVAMGILLTIYDGKEVPQWPFGLNLNSVIAA